MKKFDNIPDWIHLIIIIVVFISGFSYEHFRLDHYIQEVQDLKQCHIKSVDVGFSERHSLEQQIHALDVKYAEIVMSIKAISQNQEVNREDLAEISRKLDVLLGIGLKNEYNVYGEQSGE